VCAISSGISPPSIEAASRRRPCGRHAARRGEVSFGGRSRRSRRAGRERRRHARRDESLAERREHRAREEGRAEGVLGTLGEVFDGDAPHRPGGAPAQAWSVAEALHVLALELSDDVPRTSRGAWPTAVGTGAPP
jgi:hypothetical protein